MNAGWLIAGGVAAVGGFLWWRSRSQGDQCAEYANQIQQTANASGYGYYGSFAAQGASILCKLGILNTVLETLANPLGTGAGFVGTGAGGLPEIPKETLDKWGVRTGGLDHTGMTATDSKEPPPPAPILSDRPETRYTRSDGTSVVDYRTR